MQLQVLGKTLNENESESNQTKVTLQVWRFGFQAMQWGMQDNDVDDLHIDLLTNSPLTSSPITTHSSPLPHTPSRSGSLTSV